MFCIFIEKKMKMLYFFCYFFINHKIIYYICGESLLYTNGMSMHSSKNKKYNNEELV